MQPVAGLNKRSPKIHLRNFNGYLRERRKVPLSLILRHAWPKFRIVSERTAAETCMGTTTKKQKRTYALSDYW